ncbi:hypothetical protein APT_02076 [Acetobacter pasteurianus NBRC 101655]|nr:hypothetical protein APT_02076 [Acetobacter pasteurianus NBRC 101655]
MPGGSCSPTRETISRWIASSTRTITFLPKHMLVVSLSGFRCEKFSYKNSAQRAVAMSAPACGGIVTSERWCGRLAGRSGTITAPFLETATIRDGFPEDRTTAPRQKFCPCSIGSSFQKIQKKPWPRWTHDFGDFDNLNAKAAAGNYLLNQSFPGISA